MAPWSRWQWTFCGFTTASTWELLLVGMFPLLTQNNVTFFQYSWPSIFKLLFLLNPNIWIVFGCPASVAWRWIKGSFQELWRLIIKRLMFKVYFSWDQFEMRLIFVRFCCSKVMTILNKLDLSKLCEFCIKSCAERRKMTAVNWVN